MTKIFPTANDIGTGGAGNIITEDNLALWMKHAIRRNYVYSGFTVPSSSTDLTLEVASGEANISGFRVVIDVPTTVSCTASATNYIYLKLVRDASGLVTGAAFEVNTTGIAPDDSVLLAEAITDATTVTSTTDKRPLSGSAGGGIETISFTAGSKTSLTSARAYMASCMLNGKVYIFGGYDGTTVLATAEVWEDGVGWTALTAMPTARYGALAVTDGSKIYVIGGYDGVAELATLEIYDPVTNTWTTGAPMSLARVHLFGGYVNGKIYAIGGETAIDTTVSAAVEEYDPATDTWVTKTSAPTGRTRVGATVLNGKIHAICGADGSLAYSFRHDIYDPSTDTWTTASYCPFIANPGTIVVGAVGGLIVAAGENNADSTTPTYIYFPDTDSWVQVTDIPSAYKYGAVCSDGSTLHRLGGILSTTYVTVHISYSHSIANSSTDGMLIVRSGSQITNYTSGKIADAVALKRGDWYGIDGWSSKSSEFVKIEL